MRGTRLFLAALSALLIAACSRAPATPDPVRAVRTLTVGAVAAGARVDYAGEVRARTETRLSFRVPGKLTSRPANIGDAVQRGQVLAQLDADDLALAQEAARAALQAARVNAEQAGAEFNRFRELRDQGFISAAELERRENSHKAARAQFEQARAQAQAQSNQARYATLVADVAGIVTAVDAEPGAVLSTGGGVLRLAHDGPRDVVFAVPEQQVDSLRALQGRAGAVQVRLWSQGESAPIAATVREVAAAADPTTRTFLVKADLGRADVRLGQTATVSLAVPGQPGMYRLPLAAVFEDQGRSMVWLLDKPSMTVRPQPVQLAGAEGNAVLVTQGLSAGQTLVSAGVHTLTAGQKVTLYPGGPAATAQR